MEHAKRRIARTGLIVLLASAARDASPQTEASAAQAVRWLAARMDMYHARFYVYEDADSAGNHFPVKGAFAGGGAGVSDVTADEACALAPFSGATCIESRFRGAAGWGGFAFLNGVMPAGETAPAANWGTEPGAGFDLTGASRLSFYARGREGGEQVEFFMAGAGWSDDGRRLAPHADSSPKISLGTVALTAGWERYTLNLKTANLRSVLCGFGWGASALRNGGREVVFYLDEITYDLPRLGEPRFLLSYQTVPGDHAFDRMARNTAYLYDNAVACIAFLAAGEYRRACLIADAMVYAMDNDRDYADGRLKNAYQAGDLALPPGWFTGNRLRTARVPGWTDPATRRWYENPTHVGITVGNQAWAMIALLQCYDASGKTAGRYLDAAVRLGEWIERFCRDAEGPGGYLAGYEGWKGEHETRLTHKSTEHAADLYAAFSLLHRLLPDDARWGERAEHAYAFLVRMVDPAGGFFRTGTEADGVASSVLMPTLDCQIWPLLALGARGVPFAGALDTASATMRSGAGFSFGSFDTSGAWMEGTAFTAALYGSLGETAARDELLRFLEQGQDASGGMVATERGSHNTGIHLSDGSEWLYYRRLHAAPTAWYVLAALGVNPYAPLSEQSPYGKPLTVGTRVRLPLPLAFADDAQVTVKRLPKGLSFNAGARVLEGVPAKPGVYPVSFTRSDRVSETVSFTVAPLPPWAQGVFDGYDEHGGLATMTITAAGRISGKIVRPGGRYVFTACGFSAGSSSGTGFTIESAARAGGSILPLSLRIIQADSRPVLGIASGTLEEEEGRVVLYRNTWRESAAPLVPWSGYYTAALPGCEAYGSGYLAFTANTRGKVKTAGKLADGTAVSLSGTLLQDDAGRLFVPVYAAPASYQGGSLFGLAELAAGAAGAAVVRPLDAVPFVWCNRNPKATPRFGEGFERHLALTGGWYAKDGEIGAHYAGRTLTAEADADAVPPVLATGGSRDSAACWDPSGIVLTPTLRGSAMTGLAAPPPAKPTDPDGNGVWDYGAVNTTGMKISLTRATGLFKGSSLVWFDTAARRHLSKRVTFQGVLTPAREVPEDGIAGRGFFLWPVTAAIADSAVTYTCKESYDFRIREQAADE